MSTHTPGPWIHRPSHTRDSTSIWTADGVKCIAQMARLEDAPVIAAAPDLLTAANMALDCAQSLNGEMTAAYAALNAAVRKAESQS